MDLIDRDKLIKAICARECGNIISEIMQIKAFVANAPTVDAVPVVHGRWEKSQYGGYSVCSACRDVYVDNDWVDGKKWNYCPNCGAKMDKDGDANG